MIIDLSTLTRTSAACAAGAAMLVASPAADAAFAPLETFDSLTLGSLGTQNGWQTFENNEGSVNVAIDPADPTNQVMELNLGQSFGPTARDRFSSANIAAPVAAGDTATMFFRIRYSGTNVDAATGFSELSDPFRVDGANHIRSKLGLGAVSGVVRTEVFDEGANNFVDSGDLEPDTWYNAWMVADTSTGTYELFVQGGSTDYASQTVVLSRRSTPETLDIITAPATLERFGIAGNNNGVSPGGTVYLDDIYFDPTGKNLTLIPEPASGAFVGLGALALFRRRRGA